MTVRIGLQIMTAIGAALAAFYWGASAMVKIPESFEIVSTVYIDPECPASPSLSSGGSADLELLGRRLALQAKLSKKAAAFAMIAAVCQLLAVSI